MAVELSRFIEEQLERLPEDHPDRRFLNSTLGDINARLLRAGVTKTTGRASGGGQHIADYYLGLKQGPYFEPVLIMAELDKSGLTTNFEYYGRKILEDIAENGNDAVGHLGLTMRVRNLLWRNHISNIPKLRASLEEGGNLPVRSRPRVRDALMRFDIQVQQHSKL